MQMENDTMSCFIVSEIGINANGSLDIAKKLIDGAVLAGCDAVKFQKRTVEVVYSKEELEKPRESQWGTTYRDQKYGLEFDKEDYDEIDKYCKEKKIFWFASAWDLESQKFLQNYDLKFNKIASAMLTHKEFLKMVASEGKYTFISTGMSTMEEIEKAIQIFKEAECPFEIMHCNSSYPMNIEDANLKMISMLRKKFKCNVGYSGHEVGLIISTAAVAMGATSIERHITLDRAGYGPDQAASVEIVGMCRLVKYIRTIENAMGDGIKKIVSKEIEMKKKLRKVDTL